VSDPYLLYLANKNMFKLKLYYSDHRAEISGGNRSDIQIPDIDIIGESGEVEQLN
jgi:hypothetical protein